MENQNDHIDFLSYCIREEDENQLLKIINRSDRQNNAKPVTPLESEYILKRYLPALRIYTIWQLITSMVGNTVGLKINSLYVIHRKGNHDIKTFRLVCDDCDFTYTYDLQKPNMVRRGSIEAPRHY